jgi:hypothetical protein
MHYYKHITQKVLFTLEIEASVPINDLKKFISCFVNTSSDLLPLDILSYITKKIDICHIVQSKPKNVMKALTSLQLQEWYSQDFIQSSWNNVVGYG